MIDNIQEIPVIWKKPHNSMSSLYTVTVNRFLDNIIKRYRKRLQIQSVIINLEMPKNSAGYSNSTFEIKLHLKLRSGKILIAESNKRSISEAMKNISREIDHQSRLSDRQKHR